MLSEAIIIIMSCIVVIASLPLLLIFSYLYLRRKRHWETKRILISLATLTCFIVVMLIMGISFAGYNLTKVGYKKAVEGYHFLSEMEFSVSRTHYEEQFFLATECELPKDAIAKFHESNYGGLINADHIAFLVELSPSEYKEVKSRLETDDNYQINKYEKVDAFDKVYAKVKENTIVLNLGRWYSEYCYTYYITFLSDGRSIIISRFSC